MLAIPRAQLVFFPLNTSAGAETPFPDVPNLSGENVEILGILTYSASQLQATPDGVSVVSAGDAPRLTCTFNKGADQMFQNIPYTDLIRSLNGGLWYETAPFPIDLTKCRIKVNGGAIATSNAAVMFIYRLRS